MKKIIISAVLCMVMAAGPAMAIDADFSGEYWVEGIYNDNYSLNESTGSTSDAYLQMRLRLKTVFKISDNLSLTTRLDGLEKRWGDADESSATTTSSYFSNFGGATGNTIGTDTPYVKSTTTVEDDDNIDLDWAYMTVKTKIGGFLIGRQNGNAWGLSYSDSAGPRDRITYVLPIDNLIIAAVYEKNKEIDGNDLTLNDGDLDKWYLTATYKSENYKAGMLYGFYNYKTFQDQWQANQTTKISNFYKDNGQVYTSSDIPSYLTTQATAHIFIPYFNGQFGPFGFKAEATYAFGEAEYDSPYHVDYTAAELAAIAGALGPTAAVLADLQGKENTDGKKAKDAEFLSYNIEASYDMGGFTFLAGYAFASGDANYNDDKVESFGYLESGDDWEKLALLTGTSYGTETVLGGMGNLAGSGVACDGGFKMFYLGADYAVNEDLKIGFIYGNSTADDVASSSWEDDHGSEYDVTLEWKIFENLTYKAIGAFLSAGDYWKAGDATAQLDDTYLLYHRLTLEF